MKVLVTGIAGTIGRIVAGLLLEAGHEVIGIDRRSFPNADEAIELHKTDIRKRAAESVFRRTRPDAVIHMATVTHLRQHSEERYRINLGGTRAVFEFAHRYGVKKAIFVGRHTFYGAAPDSPLYHTEGEPPLALNNFPELSDLVAADLFAASALWRFPEIDTSVLRFCYTLGPRRHGTLASFLKGAQPLKSRRPVVPTVMGFDPLFQFLHEEDVARAIVLSAEQELRGVYNVAGPHPMTLSTLIERAGRAPMPIPEGVFRRVLGRFGLPKLPPGAVDHLKYPVVIDASEFRNATGFKHAVDEYEAIAQYAEG